MSRTTANYNLTKGNKIVYKGTTDQTLEEREKQHKSDGKKFDKIKQVGKRKKKDNALKEEKRQLTNYRKNNKGTNPKYNKKKNG